MFNVFLIQNLIAEICIFKLLHLFFKTKQKCLHSVMIAKFHSNNEEEENVS